MPSSQAGAAAAPAGERRTLSPTVTHEPPKLKTTLKTPPKQATNPLQFVKVGPCPLYRSAQEQLKTVQEVKKVKQEVRDDPEDWQSNLDNWKSSRRKRQEHIIERVVEVKKLELEDQERQRKRNAKTLSEMMEGRGRKLSLSLAIYNEEDSNDLSDLGIGTSSGKSSVSGDAHDDTHSVLSDRDSEIEKNHSDVDNHHGHENGNDSNDHGATPKSPTAAKTPSPPPPPAPNSLKTNSFGGSPLRKAAALNNGFHHKNGNQEYDSATTTSPEPEEFEGGATRTTYRAVGQNAPRRDSTSPAKTFLAARSFEEKSNGVQTTPQQQQQPVVKIDILKRREIFEKASRENSSDGGKSNGNGRPDFGSNGKSIKERLSFLERQNEEKVHVSPRHSMDSSNSVLERFREKLSCEKEVKQRDLVAEELEGVKPLRERLSNLEKYTNEQMFMAPAQYNGELSAKSVKDRLITLDANRKDTDKRSASCFHEQSDNNRAENSTPSERSSSPDSEYRAPRGAPFHHSLDSLDADASSGPDTFERVQSLEELDYHQTRRYPASSSSAEILNDTDREDSGIHTADASCSVSQADEPIEEESGVVVAPVIVESVKPQVIVEESTEFRSSGIEASLVENELEEKIAELQLEEAETVLPDTGTADTTRTSSSTAPETINANSNASHGYSSSQRPVVYQSPRVPPRQTPPDYLPKLKPSYLPELSSPKDESLSEGLSTPDSSSTNTVCSIEPETKYNSVSPLPSPRSPSKIPTPLPRKSISSCSSSSSSPSGSPTKIPRSPPPPRSSEIPVVVVAATRSPSLEERRRTVVEVCERVMVAPGEVHATPFITLERREGDDDDVDNDHGTDYDELQQPTPEEQEEEEEPLPQSASVDEDQPLEEEEEEEEEIAEEPEEQVQEAMPEKQQAQQQVEKQEQPIMESAMLVQEVVKAQEMPAPPPPAATMAIRPTTLDLDCSASLCSDFLSPLSPVSKQQILPLSFSSDEEIVSNLAFPLGPPTSVEPPKEKPPPPPVDLSDEENHPIEPLKRLNSTRRIKKELRSRRSDFLGIEGINDDDIERELTLTKPPDIAAILAEERRIEQLHRRSYDTDSNYEQDSSHERDSGVELGQAEDWAKQPVSPDMSQHSRQSSEPFGASVTSSEEDEITRKEREIIEVLEREEQWRYENNRENSDIGEKLAHKLRELEEEKMQLEREREEAAAGDSKRRRSAETLRMNEENLRKQEELTRMQDEEEEKKKRLEEQEEQAKIQEAIRVQRERERLRQEEKSKQEAAKASAAIAAASPALSCNEEEYASRQDVLRVERELLQLEQEELKRQRSNLAYREQKQQQLAEQLQEQWKSLQDVAQPPPPPPVQPRQPQNYVNVKPQTNYRASMPNLQMQQQEALIGPRRRPPPPPIPPAKPLRMVEQRQRDVTIRNSRIPSADSIPQQIEAPLRSTCSSNAINGQSQHGQQMSRQTLQALSAAPRPRIVQGDQWVQRRKSDIPRGAYDYNYQHWLIQEAEQRRINEKNQRSPPVRKPHVTGTSVPYTASPPRPDNKPLPDSIIQTLTQRVQNRVQEKPLSPRRRLEHSASQEHLHTSQHYQVPQHKVHQPPSSNNNNNNNSPDTQEKMLSVSGKKKCSHCGDELGRGAAMIIESLRLFYHMECFKCCVCHVRLGDGLMGTDVRVRNHKLHCHNCYSSDDGVKFSCV